MMLFKGLLTGKISKRDMSKISIPIALALVIGWAIARALYAAKNGYTINHNFISQQGCIYPNPIGAWFFIITTAVFGLFFGPYMMFLYRRLLPTLK